MTPARHLKVVPPILLWCLFGGCIATALFLIPRDAELLHRLLADGKQERALELAAAAGATAEAERIEREMAGPTAPEVVIEPELDAGELLNITLSDAPPGPLDPMHIDRIVTVLRGADCNADQFARVAVRAPDMTEADIELIYGVFAAKALGRSEPGFAAEIFTKMRRLVAKPSVDTMATMVMAYRFSGQPLPALEVLESRYDLTTGKTGDLPQDLRATLVSLYFESSQPGRAFQMLKAEISETKDRSRLAELLPTAVQAASYSGHGDELAPLLERFLDSMPESRMTLPELVAAGRANPEMAAGNFVHFSKQYGQLCEWTDRYDASFDSYCKAAALGDGAALERCIALHGSLFRHDDLGKLMFALAPFEGEAKPRLTRLLALLLGGAGRYEEGEANFEEYLATNPRDIDALVALAALRAEAGDLKSALKTYHLALRERPGSVDLIARAAELHISLGQHREAFDLFRKIPEDLHTELTLEHYLMLAESLAETGELNRAQLFAFNRKKEHSADDYLDLAESYSLKGDMRNEILVLRGGVRAKPESAKLALTLADSLYREDAYIEAAALLTRRDLRDNVRALAMFIEICGGNDRFAYAIAHLPKDVEHSHRFSPSIRIELGQIYEETGRISSAEALYASVPEGREAWQLLASAKYRQGDLPRAEEYQLKYLRAAIEPDAEDWMFMGDIYKGLGKVRLADEAYRRSLTMLKASL